MKRGHRRGGLLLELMLSIALFVVAAGFCLAVTRQLFASIERGDARQRAVDLARSRMAELEAGLIGVQDLRGEWGGAIGSRPDDELDATGPAGERWEIDVTTLRTEYRGLSLIEMTVTRLEGGSAEAEPGTAYTLRQLVALREADAEAYEPDELLEGLPDGEGGP